MKLQKELFFVELILQHYEFNNGAISCKHYKRQGGPNKLKVDCPTQHICIWIFIFHPIYGVNPASAVFHDKS